MRSTHTFGFPVVPLEKLRKASFVFPSPGLSLRSVYVNEDDSPSATRSDTEGKGMDSCVVNESIIII